ncbi:MAG: GH92 family glycosyl hydrolase [Saprospiraceae bacterium]|nr:GH92 family glycosyl hydrolase [Saprospiraceae bacterium]
MTHFLKFLGMNARRRMLCIPAITGVLMLCHSCAGPGYGKLVNPFVGTGGHGHTFPGACYPFGMMQLSPDTRTEGWDACSGYHFSDTAILGFSHTHLSGTGVPDYCDFLVTPLRSDEGWPNFRLKGIPLTKGREEARAGYYRVNFPAEGIDAELTVGKRTGMHRYRFAGSRRRFVLLDLTHRDVLIGGCFTSWDSAGIRAFRRSTGWAKDQVLYFSARFSSPFTSIRYSEDSLKALLEFARADGSPLIIHTAISAVDSCGAEANLSDEWMHFGFDRMLKQTERTWNLHLGRIKAKSREPMRLRTFYTALYHTMIHPSLFQDADGRYRSMDGSIRQTQSDDHFTVFSLWDTYRAAHPLYQLAFPDYNDRFVRTFLRQFEASGYLPVWELAGNETWCMIGNHAIPVIANAFAAGEPRFDTALARKAVRGTLNAARHSGLRYMNKGFIAAEDEAESVSKTIENSLDLAAAAAIGVAVDVGPGAYAYRNLYNPASGFFQARSNNQFLGPFDPREVNFNYTEANAYQYLFGAHHDVGGMIRLFGGAKDFENRLDEIFIDTKELTGRQQADITGLIGQCAHGNEPSHHLAYLYNAVGRPDKAQDRIIQLRDGFYQNVPEGLIGNEDCGQMSAWYVFSALGFYPVHSFDGSFDMGCPSFDFASIKIPGRKAIRIRSRGGINGNRVERFDKNGRFPGTRFHLTGGDELEFDMGPVASRFPASTAHLTTGDGDLQPFVSKGSRTFQNHTEIALDVADGAPVEYCFDTLGEIPRIYHKPLAVDSETSLFFRRVNKHKTQPWQFAKFAPKPVGYKLSLGCMYANAYAASGPEALIDGLHGGPDFRDGNWQGYQGQDFMAELHFDTLKTAVSGSVRFFKDERSWIMLPKAVWLEFSTDGSTFQSLGPIKPKHSPEPDLAGVSVYEFSFQRMCRALRIRAGYPGPMPPGHPGEGGTSWIFCDEIIIHH